MYGLILYHISLELDDGLNKSTFSKLIRIVMRYLIIEHLLTLMLIRLLSIPSVLLNDY